MLSAIGFGVCFIVKSPTIFWFTMAVFMKLPQIHSSGFFVQRKEGVILIKM